MAAGCRGEWTLGFTVSVALTIAPLHAASCESLTSLALPNTSITLARTVEAGTFNPRASAPPGSKVPPAFRDLPAFCRIAAMLTPSSDSTIKIEIWIPSLGWNGKFQGVGNGGWAGNISYAALAAAVKQGYASASTDTGHEGVGASGSFAAGHPEKLIDFAYRAVHEMTVSAKAIVTAYGGKGPRYSYWNGCSTGGRQGLKEAQQYPADYDGIAAGAPANNWTHLQVGSMWVYRAAHRSPGSYIPPSKYPLIHRAALQACDAQDGVVDSVIDDPTRCHFDPKVLLCAGADNDSCLTAAQVEAARNIYATVKNPRTGKEINPGLEPGSEMGWAGLAGPEPIPAAVDEFRYQVFQDPDWKWSDLNFDTGVALADKADGGKINASDPNMREFTSRGGKLLLYQGWSDQLVAPRNAVQYYKAVEYALGSPEDSVRLFMVPGMAHCGGGDGVSDFDKIGVLEQWVERGKAPEEVVAARIVDGKTVRTRPLCPYPQVARYKGSGSTDEASNFACSAP